MEEATARAGRAMRGRTRLFYRVQGCGVGARAVLARTERWAMEGKIADPDTAKSETVVLQEISGTSVFKQSLPRSIEQAGFWGSRVNKRFTLGGVPAFWRLALARLGQM